MANGRAGSNLGGLKTGQHKMGNNSTRAYFIRVKVGWRTNGLGKKQLTHIYPFPRVNGAQLYNFHHSPI